MKATMERLGEHLAGDRPAAMESLTEAELSVLERIGETVEFVDHPSFPLAATEERLFGQSATQIEVPGWTQYPEVPEDIDRSLRTSKKPKLRPQEEATLFLRYNYARWRLAKLAQAQQRRRSAHRAREMVRWYEQAQQCRSDLVGANMALVLAMAKRTRIPNVEFAELVSEGNMALLRAVEKFDVSRGFRFSTYACRAILKGFNRMASKTGRYRQHFPTEYDPDLERSDQTEADHDRRRSDSIDAIREILTRNRAALSDLERTIIMERFAIAGGGRKRTLTDVGKMVGLTNERVRQIQNLALGKIRSVLDEEYMVA
ncbi:MAG TPA: hypothetical protein DCX07_14610 [Phycisphaerales bacterium]|nr:hypothetical protein [Phycisphaerales bacterium]